MKHLHSRVLKQHLVSIWSKIKSSLPLQGTLIVAFLILLDAILLHLGFYDRHIPVDIPQHILAGLGFGFIPFQLIRYYRVDLPRYISSYLIVSTAVFGGFAWEVFEYTSQKLLPSFSEKYYFYSKTPEDLLSDMAFGTLGGLALALIFLYITRKQKV